MVSQQKYWCNIDGFIFFIFYDLYLTVLDIILWDIYIGKKKLSAFESTLQFYFLTLELRQFVVENIQLEYAKDITSALLWHLPGAAAFRADFLN